MDAGVAATELTIDSIKTLLATSTVATRQWYWAGDARNWLTPVTHHPAALPDPVTAAITSLQ